MQEHVQAVVCTHLILDGLQDLDHAAALSRRWMNAGYANTVDPAGQGATLARRDGGPLTEADVARAAGVARGFGVELRDRLGTSWTPVDDPAQFRGRMAYEYKSRFATAVVFGLPALALRELGPWLAGGAQGPRDLLYPWLFEMLLVGWACLAAGWPILWNAGLAALHLRATPDLLTGLIVLAAWCPSAVGTLWLISGDTWLAQPRFDAALWAVLLATLQRWLAYRFADRLAGRAMLMVGRLSRLVAFWLVLASVAAIWQGWTVGLATALLLPPMIGVGAIHPLTPGLSMTLPVLGFAGLLLLGPAALQLPVGDRIILIAAGFGLIMTAVFALGWRAWPPR